MTYAEMESVVIEIQWELGKLMTALGPIRTELGIRAAQEYAARRSERPAQQELFG